MAAADMATGEEMEEARAVVMEAAMEASMVEVATGEVMVAAVMAAARAEAVRAEAAREAVERDAAAARATAARAAAVREAEAMAAVAMAGDGRVMVAAVVRAPESPAVAVARPAAQAFEPLQARRCLVKFQKENFA